MKIHGNLKKILDATSEDDNSNSANPTRTRNSSLSQTNSNSDETSINSENPPKENEEKEKEIQKIQKLKEKIKKYKQNDKWWKKRRELDKNLRKTVINSLFFSLFPEISENDAIFEEIAEKNEEKCSESENDDIDENLMETETENSQNYSQNAEMERNAKRGRTNDKDEEQPRNEDNNTKTRRKRRKTSSQQFSLTFSSILEEKLKEEEIEKEEQRLLEIKKQKELEILKSNPNYDEKLENFKKKLKSSLSNPFEASIFDLFPQLPKKTEKNDQNYHFLLLFDDDFLVHTLPWESIPIFRYRSVSRLLSLHFSSIFCKFQINSAKQQTSHVSSKNCSFLLNPKGDLKSTETEFSEDFKKFEKSLNWKGAIHLIPPNKDFGNWLKNSAENNSCYLYFGHNSGDQYISIEDIIKDNQNSSKTDKKEENSPILPVSLLMGCSSATFKQLNWKQLHCDGVVNYFMSEPSISSKCVIGFLWDVTDIDCDRIGSFLLTNWLFSDSENLEGGKLFKEERAKQAVEFMKKNGHNKNVCEVLAFARNSTKMEFLTGASVVCYGFPAITNK